MVGGAAEAIGAAAASLVRPGKVTDDQARLIDKVTAAATSGASLSDVKHIVILMQENRGVRPLLRHPVRSARLLRPGRSQERQRRRPIFDQYGYQPGSGPGAAGYLQPFRLLNNPPGQNGEDTNDIDHSWAGRHGSWNAAGLDSFVTSHLATDGAANGPVTMGSSPAPSWPSTTRWPTPSRSATATTARCSAPPTRTG